MLPEPLVYLREFEKTNEMQTLEHHKTFEETDTQNFPHVV